MKDPNQQDKSLTILNTFHMSANTELEIKVIKKFLVREKRDRYAQLVSRTKNRQKFINDLAHFDFFKWDLFEEVNDITADIILTTLQKNMIPGKTCYVISENAKIDATTSGIREAVQETIGYGMGTILVFGDADMIFYEGETMNSRYLSKSSK